MDQAEQAARALAEIDHILQEMLFLAQLSASELTLDRRALQRALDGCVAEIDRIAGAAPEGTDFGTKGLFD